MAICTLMRSVQKQCLLLLQEKQCLLLLQEEDASPAGSGIDAAPGRCAAPASALARASAGKPCWGSWGHTQVMHAAVQGVGCRWSGCQQG